jgi:predicted aldo/keto reductase-like oxidoreductase
MNRRTFIEKGVVAGTALGVFPAVSGSSGLPKRNLGKTGETLSIIGFGGILVMDMAQPDANNLVAYAYDSGINYYDVAPTYGNAQDQLGPALQPYRSNCFLACKTTQRKRAEAEKELNDSLLKLRTDHFDLYQLHALTTRQDVETAFAANGAMEAVIKARQEGKIRFVGFSAHSEEAALLAMETFHFDTILFPINFVCWFEGHFGPRVVEKAKSLNMGILALKSLAFTVLAKDEKRPFAKCWYRPIESDEIADLSLRFTLSQGTTAAVTPGEAPFLYKAVQMASTYRPLSENEIAKLAQTAKGAAPLFRA